jgi:hypothetical protein
MPIPVVIIQPPLVQLNGPYPSGAYLSAFFRSLPGESSVRWIDASNLLFRSLFSQGGLSRLFALSRESALAAAGSADAEEETAFQLRRYVSTADRWISWIDGIVAILCGGSRELCHSFIRSPGAPRGARMDAFLAGLETEPGPDDARMLATLALEDIADYVTAAFDGEFSLVRYAESIAASERSFAKIEAALDRPLVREFYEPLLDGLWEGLSGVGRPDGSILFCISVPFPGCLVNALATARSIRRHFGDRAVISMGGGYVNTELRSCENERLHEYVDTLCFDRGYGAYAALLGVPPEFGEAGGIMAGATLEPGSAAHDAPSMTRGLSIARPVSRRLVCPPEYEPYERRVTETLVPDYADIDFSLYPRLADDPNPMHRLWSDGAWIKAYLAHGCYWHRCSFCDVSLDYIRAYLPVGTRRLYDGLRRQAIEKGVYGIHLVDEAAPPRALRDFALANLMASRDGGLIPFWGNIRFEKTFSRDLADFLSAGGLAAVSGGIEIASPEGFKSVDKGIDLANLVAVCAAFKEAGVLVHSYLIYGYWDEDAQGVVDAAETMRQLFAAGLVDSAFWHKFVLTRHSRVYGEYGRGMHRGLAPVDERGDFADNDLRFSGEMESERFTAPLDAALQSWMGGESLDRPVRKWFPFPMPAPRVEAGLIDRYIADYERARDHERNRPCDPAARYFWTASEPVSAGGGELAWWHLGEEIRLPADAALAGAIRSAIHAGRGGSAAGQSSGSVTVEADSAELAKLTRSVFRALRHHGLVRISL